MTKSLPNRTCPYSGIEFTPRRRNQIYANAQYRIAHNNEKSRIKRNSTSKIDKLIRNNYKILLELMGSDKVKIVHSQYLRGAGFSFKVFTHFADSKSKDYQCYGIYNFSYCKYDNNNYKIEKDDRH